MPAEVAIDPMTLSASMHDLRVKQIEFMRIHGVVKDQSGMPLTLYVDGCGAIGTSVRKNDSNV